MTWFLPRSIHQISRIQYKNSKTFQIQLLKLSSFCQEWLFAQLGPIAQIGKVAQMGNAIPN